MRTIIKIGFWLSLCSNWCLGETVSGMSMTKLSEGIKVTPLGQLYPTVAKWTSAVSLEPPRIHHSIKEAVRTLQYLIFQFNYSDHSSVIIKDNWNMRMSWIESTLHIPPIRQKRSPLGFIGEVSHVLFGTVTKGELAKYKSALLKLGKSVNGTIHVSNQLLTVSRQIHTTVIQNSHHIRKLRSFLAKFRSQTIENLQILSYRLNRIEHRSVITNALGTLEQATQRILNQMSALHTWKQAIENQNLDESILPPAQLASILQAAADKGYRSPPMEWIYTFVRVTPVSRDSARLIFKVTFPLYSKADSFISYSFASWPVWTKQGYKAQISLQPKLAVSTVTRSTFIPSKCIGANPSMCSIESLRGNSNFRCERSLIGLDPAGRNHCGLKIVNTNVTQVWTTGEGEYIVSSVGEQAELMCESKLGRIYTFHPSVYQIRIPAGCSLHMQGIDWTLPGSQQFNNAFSVKQSTVVLSVLHNIRTLSKPQLLKLATVPDWIPLKDIPHFLPTDLPTVPKLNFVENNRLLPVFNSSTSVFTIAVFIAIGGYLVFKRKMCTKGQKAPSNASAPPAESIPMLNLYPKLPVTVPPTEEPQQARAPSS